MTDISLYDITFVVEDDDGNSKLYTTKMDYDHSFIASLVDMDDLEPIEGDVKNAETFEMDKVKHQHYKDMIAHLESQNELSEMDRVKLQHYKDMVKMNAESFESEGEMITITGVVSKSYFEELMDGSEPFHDVEWDIQEGNRWDDFNAETFSKDKLEYGKIYCSNCKKESPDYHYSCINCGSLNTDAGDSEQSHMMQGYWIDGDNFPELYDAETDERKLVELLVEYNLPGDPEYIKDLLTEANMKIIEMKDYYGAESFNAEIPKELDCKDEPYDHSTELNNKGFFQNLHDWSNTDDMGVEYCYNCGQYALTTPSTRILSDEEYQELRHGYAAEGKKRSGLLSEPFEGTSLDSGDWKGILTGFSIGLLGLFGYSKLRE